MVALRSALEELGVPWQQLEAGLVEQAGWQAALSSGGGAGGDTNGGSNGVSGARQRLCGTAFDVSVVMVCDGGGRVGLQLVPAPVFSPSPTTVRQLALSPLPHALPPTQTRS